MTAMKIEAWPLDKIRPYDGNPRINSDEATAAIGRSLIRFGWRQPIVVDEAGEILAGEGRWLGASWAHREGHPIAGWKDTGKAPVYVARDATDAEKRAYRLADNKLRELRPWDNEQLRIELDDLAGLDFEIEDLGFDLSGMDLGPVDFQPAGIDEQGQLDRIKPITCPNCGHEFEKRF